jgi:hypothetical protein
MYSSGRVNRDVDDARYRSQDEPINGLKVETVHIREGEEAAVRSRARGRSAQKEKEISDQGTIANRIRLT